MELLMQMVKKKVREGSISNLVGGQVGLIVHENFQALFQPSLFHRLQGIVGHLHLDSRRVRSHRVAPTKTSGTLGFMGFSVLKVMLLVGFNLSKCKFLIIEKC